MHACSKCRRVLKYATRDSWCTRCIAAATSADGYDAGFDEDVKTVPNIRPQSLLAA